MKIINFTEGSNGGTLNVYLVQNERKVGDDISTLVDVGCDVAMIDKIKDVLNGAGENKLGQIVLTHNCDCSAVFPLIKKQLNPDVCAFSEFRNGIDLILKDGQNLKMGNQMFEVIHVPTPANDSICLFCEESGVLFSGDAALDIRSPDAARDHDFINVLLRLSRKKINAIYFGYGKPRLNGCNEMILRTLNNITCDCSKKVLI